jgi:DNA-binding winged helix-turn-helix (wHTH) protein/tetratricopeptide (TPR) repeat protein/TolB-like protein
MINRTSVDIVSQMTSSKGNQVLQFGDFCLDVSERILSRKGEFIPLAPKVFDTLLVLVENRGRIVEKDKLMQCVWPETFVEEANLSVNISALRKVLAEEAGKPRFIKTVPKRGYCFIAEVQKVPSGQQGFLMEQKTELVSLHLPTEKEVEKKEINDETPATVSSLLFSAFSRLTNHRKILLLIIFLLLTVTYKGDFYRKPKPEPFSIVVLPFENLNQDPKKDHLKIVLANWLISRLREVEDLKVRPTVSIRKYVGSVKDPKTIAQELKANVVLKSGYWREGNDLKVWYELIDIRKNKIIGSGELSNSGEYVTPLLHTFAWQIAEALHLTPVAENHVMGTAKLYLNKKNQVEPPANMKAFEWYLRGCKLYEDEDFSIAIGMLNRSLELDPTYVTTWIQLGRTYIAKASTQSGGREDYKKAGDAFDEALRLDPNNLDAMVFKANLLTDTNQVEDAVNLLQKVIDIDPDHARAHWVLGYAYRYGGMSVEADEESQLALQLDPKLKLIRATLNVQLYWGYYDLFILSLVKENSAFILFYRGFAYFHLKDKKKAISNFDRAYQLDPFSSQVQIGKALSFFLSDQHKEAREMLKQTEQEIEQKGIADGETIYKLAQAYTVVGDTQCALRTLRRSIEKGFFCYLYFQADPLILNLRNEPEFKALMEMAQTRSEAFKQQFAWY